MTEAKAARAPTIPSPCVNVCQMNPYTGLCRGCFRTLDEIAGWLDFSNAEKTEILKRLAGRNSGATVR
jgi:uncharacterized protein